MLCHNEDTRLIKHLPQSFNNGHDHNNEKKLEQKEKNEQTA